MANLSNGVGRDDDRRSDIIMKLLTLKETAEKCGISTRSIYRILEKDPSFPKPTKPYGRKHYFVEGQVDQWLTDATSDNAKSSYV